MSFAGERQLSFVNGWSKSLSLVFPLANYALPPLFSLAFSFTPSAADSQDFNWVEAPTSKPRVFTYNQFLCKLRDHLALIGNNPTLYAGHSFRRGGVTFAYQSGVLIEPIKALGDWRSDTILIYTSPCF